MNPPSSLHSDDLTVRVAAERSHSDIITQEKITGSSVMCKPPARRRSSGSLRSLSIKEKEKKHISSHLLKCDGGVGDFNCPCEIRVR